MLQLIFHLRPHPHQFVAVNQQLPQIFLLARGHPDPRKAPVEQQLQQQGRIAPVMLLLPHIAGPNLRRIAHPQLVSAAVTISRNH